MSVERRLGGSELTLSPMRVVLIGLGDLADRLAASLVQLPLIGELVLAGRRASRGPALAQLLRPSAHGAVRFVSLDALELDSLVALLTSERPQLVVQCGSLLSPWALSNRLDPVGAAFRNAGFALQLPSQLPIIMNVMRAMRSAGLASPVVNCSYPDVTHAILAHLGLSPTIGVGNVGMIVGVALAAWASRGREVEAHRLRALAHHSQVASVVSRDPARCGTAPRPRLYVGDSCERVDELAYEGAPIVSDQRLNALTVAHALTVIRALLSGGSFQTSAPGPLGLPGGYPVEIRGGQVALDLPSSLTVSDAVAFQNESSMLDGLAAIDDDGTVHFTDAARSAVGGIAPVLAAPLRPEDALSRFGLLARALGLPPP